MGGIPLLCALTCVMVDPGWQPDGSGGYRYIVQISAEQLADLERSGSITSRLPAALVGRVSQVEIRIGAAAPPQEPPLEQVVARYPVPPDASDTVRGQGGGGVGLPPTLGGNGGSQDFGGTVSRAGPATRAGSEPGRTDRVGTGGPTTGSGARSTNGGAPRSPFQMPSDASAGGAGATGESWSEPNRAAESSPGPQFPAAGRAATVESPAAAGGMPAGLPASISLDDAELDPAEMQLQADEQLLTEVELRQIEDGQGNRKTLFFDRRSGEPLRADDPRYAEMLDLLVRQGELTRQQAEGLLAEADALIRQQARSGRRSEPPFDDRQDMGPFETDPLGSEVSRGGGSAPRDYQQPPAARRRWDSPGGAGDGAVASTPPSRPAGYGRERPPANDRWDRGYGDAGTRRVADRRGWANSEAAAGNRRGRWDDNAGALSGAASRWADAPDRYASVDRVPAGGATSGARADGLSQLDARRPVPTRRAAQGGAEAGGTRVAGSGSGAEVTEDASPRASEVPAPQASSPSDTSQRGEGGREVIEPGPLLLGLLMLSLVINGYLAIAISRLLQRYRNLISSNRGTALSG